MWNEKKNEEIKLVDIGNKIIKNKMVSAKCQKEKCEIGRTDRTFWKIKSIQFSHKYNWNTFKDKDGQILFDNGEIYNQ